MQKRSFILMIVLLVSGLLYGQQETDVFPGLHLNQVQLIGSHNSYKPGIEPGLWKIIYADDSAAATALQYGHIGFTDQLNLGLRNLEIDVVYDPHGGTYADPLGMHWMKQNGITPLPFDAGNDLLKPGLKVFHVPDVDFRSHHLLFVDCLKELKQWSAMHPGHLPVIITMNTKDSNRKGLHEMLPFTKAAMDSIDQEIRSVLDTQQLITPDLIRGNYQTLNEAVLKSGWPLISEVKGRFLFVLDEKGDKMETYKAGHPSLAGRVMFVNEKQGSPEAAFMIVNNAKKDEVEIRQLVKQGYLVRTRADSDTKEARINDYSTFKAAQKSDAQIITTDYYLPSTLFKTTYKVIFDNGKYVRKNKLSKQIRQHEKTK
ncbi:phosphatidylinositol-specific phospholipase C1-like protein [soil metagenome]